MIDDYTLTYDSEVKEDYLYITINCSHPAFPFTHSIPLRSAISAASDDSSLDSIVRIAASREIRKYNRQEKISDIDLSGTVELTSSDVTLPTQEPAANPPVDEPDEPLVEEPNDRSNAE